jgi:pyruvate/2-oxoglutarate dehydrogenase complex dihydrolipoamide acyltransferase (E2) component
LFISYIQDPRVLFQFIVKATAAGEVQALLYKQGDTVAKDAALVKMKFDEEEVADHSAD